MTSVRISIRNAGIPRTAPAARLARPLAAALGSVCLAAAASAQTSLVSVNYNGGVTDLRSYWAELTPDGRFVAFVSLATNLVPDDTNYLMDVFVRDLAIGANERVSVDSDGREGEGICLRPSISADGRYVAFASLSTNLVPGDTNGVFDVFVRDRQLGTTERVSLTLAGNQASGGGSRPKLSADGRYVAFWASDELLPDPSNGWMDVFVRDLHTGAIQRISVDSSGAQAEGESSPVGLSADGRFVAFTSEASNLVPGDTNRSTDVFVHDRRLTTTERVSVPSSGGQGDAAASDQASISADGRFVAFSSFAENLVPGDTNGWADIFVHDRSAGTTARVVLGPGGVQPDGHSYDPRISSDGQHLSFWSFATNLIPGDNNGAPDAFGLDLVSGTIRRASVSSTGAEGEYGGSYPVVSGDGRMVVFQSSSSNLVPNDLNGVTEDIFLRDERVGVEYCFGDGSASACPCGNTGAAGRGCANSSGVGARLAGVGSAGVSADDLVFEGSGLLPSQPALLFAGHDAVNGGVGLPFGDGLRCAGGSLVRLGTLTPTVEGAARWGPGLSTQGDWNAGDLRRFQAWYRDPGPLSPCGAGFNLTNGVEITFGP